ncbi:NADH:ubiquinone oxidoreductase 24 kD subunit [Rivularia sp. PCC 7116]|uniref:(2Fe-2S) ferredoxin domain-containing protein n=1 Tax=Rivularia sp. PCC 7116 TaxID=373994 RepID=UPI00029EE7D5|nr:(2Fe-2S) ferredoxin domain-containing protein [Rivularia sp. PCC 7116]AFY52999.1 NADH:ubiquinone oxidoreductase 24 kD subunit [Rivularia sp. PCC 7116]
MGKSHRTETSEFCLQGRFLDFVIKDGYKLRGLLLETAEGERYIKLAKHLRHSFDLRLPPGSWLQVVGEKKYDTKTGEVKLKAERVMAARQEAEIRQEALAIPSEKKKEKSAKPPKANTILVCQKSSCMKRGGKKLCQALAASISERGLEDQVTIKGTGCMKKCKAGPNLIMPDKTRYTKIQAEQVSTLMDKHFGPKEQVEITIPEVVDVNRK